MTPPQAQPASLEGPRADASARSAAAGAEGPFVINLCSSTTPLALSQPRDPALARYTFFMSRRREDGRERFRLHMGYFETLADAEELLAVVREVYPGAWAGEVPGKKLREQATAPAPAPMAAPPALARAAPEPQPARAPAPPQSELKIESRIPPGIPQNVPVLQAAPAAATTATRSIPPAARMAAARTQSALVRAPALSAASGARVIEAGARASEAMPGARQPAARHGVAPPPPAPRSARPAAAVKPQASALQLSNVREVLASLDESGATRRMPAAANPSAGSTPSRSTAPRATPEEIERSLTDTQVLKLLEARRADGGPAEEDSSISLLKPDDTGTRRALKEAVAADAPVSFAVQLQWSVQPIDAAKVPPLAIFSAYTLYTVEGSREGRRWYGLRLGFFSDAVSAKQVAHYVRSEFKTVAVVPVSPQERTRATDSGTGGKRSAVIREVATAAIAPRPAPGRSPLRDRLPEPTAEFKLIDDEPASVAQAPSAQAHAPRAPTVKPSPAPASKRAGKAPAGRVRARERRSPQTLEETLEILGADQLEIDPGRDTLSDTGVRHLTVQVRKDSPFTKLLDRLSERARGK